MSAHMLIAALGTGFWMAVGVCLTWRGWQVHQSKGHLLEWSRLRKSQDAVNLPPFALDCRRTR